MITPPPRPMTTFDSRLLQLPLNPGLSHSSVCTPTHHISHHHKHHTWCLLYYLAHLPSNTQGQTRRLLPHVHLKTPRGQTVHPLSYSTLTTQRRKRQRNQDCGMPKRDYATKQTEQQDARLKEPTRHLIRGCRGKERFAAPAPAGPSIIPLVAPCPILTPSRSPLHAHAHANMPKRHRRRYRRFFFGTSLPQQKGGGVGSGRAAAAAAKIRSCHSSSSARQGKQDKYS
jgi:hypothetical protein